MRWYCWIIIFAIAFLSTCALPTDGDVPEKDVQAVDNENDSQDIALATRLLDDDDDDVLIGEQEALDIADRHHRQRKPEKHRKDDDSGSSDDEDDDDDDDESKENGDHNKGHYGDDKKDGKKPKITKCICFEKKHPGKPGQRPHQSDKNRQHPSKPAGNSSHHTKDEKPENQSGFNAHQTNN
jgi:hypothetical protein